MKLVLSPCPLCHIGIQWRPQRKTYRQAMMRVFVVGCRKTNRILVSITLHSSQSRNCCHWLKDGEGGQDLGTSRENEQGGCKCTSYAPLGMVNQWARSTLSVSHRNLTNLPYSMDFKNQHRSKNNCLNVHAIVELLNKSPY